ncbi:hypothetical protein CEW88_17580 [Alloyangia pacifica]|uniref:Lcl C-terminal domain-containing protein n=1 Tax=Alloyangia pacifica TaxID=311180 RepID=A0A2U8HIG9_9RHOB|nr:hypothetical protein CEW88_17580 [Alloyangia pacifica]
MFAMPQDLGNRLLNSGNSANYAVTSATDLVTGLDNTKVITTVDADSGLAGFQVHVAAQYCYDLESHGADDWYLPARSELATICTSGNSIPGLVVSGYPENIYWSSSESNATNARYIRMDTCAFGGGPKQNAYKVRCVRKGPAPRCANPYGMEGDVMYNTTHSVLQFCDGARWIAIGKTAP